MAWPFGVAVPPSQAGTNGLSLNPIVDRCAHVNRSQSVRPLCSQVVESLLEELRPRAHELQEKLITAMAAAERKSDELESIELRFALTNLVTSMFAVLSLPLCVRRIGVALWLYVRWRTRPQPTVRLFCAGHSGETTRPRVFHPPAGHYPKWHAVPCCALA